MPAEAPQLPAEGLASPARPEGHAGARLLRLDEIRLDGDTQPRKRKDPEAINDYADALQAGAAFPPVTVFFDGATYWLADGFHRWEAHAEAGFDEVWADIRQGDQRAAILYSVGANALHGLRRTNEDKRRAVFTLLRDEEWGKESDRWIARTAGVDSTWVGTLRAEHRKELQDQGLVSEDSLHMETRTVRRGAQVYERHVDLRPRMERDSLAPRVPHGRPVDAYAPEVEQPLETETLEGQRRAKLAAAVAACRELPPAEAKILTLLPIDLTMEEVLATARWWHALYDLMGWYPTSGSR